MNKRWQNFEKKWKKISKRERALIMGTILVFIGAMSFVFMLEPSVKTINTVPSKISALEKQIKAQEQILATLKMQTAIDPNKEVLATIDRLEKAIKDQKSDLKEASASLVSPDQMLAMMESVLTKEKGVSLLRVRNLPKEELELKSDKKEKHKAAVTALLYVHPLEVELKGTYQGLFDYINKLEGLDGVFFWDVLEYNVDEHPYAHIRLKVHTLSYDEGWLGV
ncbi:hypothetical protein [Neptuniibacter sp. QD37_11]|uniref:hypothetical protein n=1 Tax=Neptuniibacter sp. QD37_11 TaxID=3398209 RepID=UPI0039F56908